MSPVMVTLPSKSSLTGFGKEYMPEKEALPSVASPRTDINPLEVANQTFPFFPSTAILLMIFQSNGE